MDTETRERIKSSNKQAIKSVMSLHSDQLSEQFDTDMEAVQCFISETFTFYNSDGNVDKAVLKTYLFQGINTSDQFQVILRCQLLRVEDVQDNLSREQIRNHTIRKGELAFRTLYFTATPEKSNPLKQYLHITGSIAVTPSLERIGIGSSLLSTIEQVRKMLAQKLTEKSGFTLVKIVIHDDTGGKADRGWTSKQASQMGYIADRDEKRTFSRVERY